jgi:DNA polymerase III subunit epsilon
MSDWFKRKPGPEIRKAAWSKDARPDSLRYVVLDTELTSLDDRTNRLLSVGGIAMQGASIKLGGQFYRVTNAQVSIPADTIVIHKLRPEDVESGEPMGKVLEDLREFIEGAVLVGHFVDIELKILQKEMKQTGHILRNPAIDTARIHPWILRQGPFTEDLPVSLEKLDLPTLANFYHVEIHDAHQALSDAYLTARVWQKMLHILQQKGIDTLRKLLRIGGT